MRKDRNGDMIKMFREPTEQMQSSSIQLHETGPLWQLIAEYMTCYLFENRIVVMLSREWRIMTIDTLSTWPIITIERHTRFISMFMKMGTT